MPQKAIGINVAPLIDLLDCPLENASYRLFEGLEIVAPPRVQIDQNDKDWLGGSALEELTTARYALQYTYDALPSVHLGEPEKISDEILKRALISLWITKPTGACIKYFFRYREPWHTDNAASIGRHQSWLHPNITYKQCKLNANDLDVFSSISKMVHTIFENRKALRRSLYYLNSALHLQHWESGFVMFTITLESLFTTDSNEITHKIAERIAWFLESKAEKRREVFNQMKEIYQIRSKIVHGADIRKMSSERSRKLLADLEYLTRKIMKKILQDQSLIDSFSDKQKNREKFLTSLLFQ